MADEYKPPDFSKEAEPPKYSKSQLSYDPDRPPTFPTGDRYSLPHVITDAALIDRALRLAHLADPDIPIHGPVRKDLGGSWGYIEVTDQLDRTRDELTVRRAFRAMFETLKMLEGRIKDRGNNPLERHRKKESPNVP